MDQDIIIFIDGENFFRSIKENFFNYNISKRDPDYVRTKDLKKGFDLIGFCKYVTRADTDNLKKIYYYDARLGSDFSNEVIANQNRFLKDLSNKGVIVRIGKVENKRQKGTDVYLATDLLTLGWKKEYKLAFLFSSDKDFRPAIDYLQRNNKRCSIAVQYCHFHYGYCRALDDVCLRTQKFKNGEILRFCSTYLVKRWKPKPK